MPGVESDRRGPILILRMDDPETMNALSGPIRDGLAREVPKAIADPEIRVLILTGTGKAFCAGGDIRSMSNRAAPGVRQRIKGVHDWSAQLLTSETLCLTAINGAAAGAGFGIALLGDMIFASAEAIFKAGFPGVGAIPDIGLGYTLPRAVGHQRAMEILTLNRTITAEEAERIGLVQGIFPTATLLDEVVSVAEKLAASPLSVNMTKTLLRRGHDEGLELYHEFEQAMQAIAFNTEDFGEGVEAFLQKRKPTFRGA